MKTETYHARLRAQQAEWALLNGDERAKRSARARERSARRWADDDARTDQQRRAGCLELVHSLAADDGSGAQGESMGDSPEHGQGKPSAPWPSPTSPLTA